MAVLNQSDCESLFNKSSIAQNSKLLSFKLAPFTDQILGYLGDHLRLTLTAANGAETSLFVKVVQSNKGMLRCFEDVPLYEKELFVYKLIDRVRDALPTCSVDVVPKLLLSKTTPAGGKVMVFENLQLQGFQAPKSHKLSPEEIHAGLATLAKFHSISLGYEALGKGSVVKEAGEDTSQSGHDILHPFFVKTDKNTSGYKYFMASQDGALELAKLLYPDDASLTSKITDACQEALDIINDENSWRKVLCQGDLWGFNLLFKHDDVGQEIKAKILDFQLCRYAPPAHDVTMLVYMATDGAVRKKYIGQFYESYYNALKAELTKLGLNIDEILSEDEFHETCKVYMKVAKFIWVTYRQTSEQSRENTIAMGKDCEYMINAIIGDGRPASIRRLFEIDPPYKRGITHIFSEFLETIKYHPLSIEEIYMIIGKKLFKNYGKLLDFDLIDCTSKQITKVTGYLGTYYQISLTVKVASAPKKIELLRMKLFAKMLPKTEALKDFHAETNCGFKETRFYSSILPKMASVGLVELQESLPMCYLATREGLVFDDMVTGYNYAMGNVRASMPLEEVKLSLTALARLHASGLLLEAKTKRKLPELYPTEFQETFYNQKEMSKNLLKAGKHGITMGIDLFYKNHPMGNKLSPDVDTLQEFARQAIDRFTALIQPSAKYRNTICHGDLWASNWLFPPSPATTDASKGSVAKIIDFQSYRYCPCTHDLTQFLHFTLFRAERREHWQDMLNYYYAQFERVFATHGYSVDDFMSYECFLKSAVVEEEFALYQSLTHFQTIMLTSESLQALFADAEKSRRYIFEDRSQHVLHHWQDDAIYRERLTGVIDDLREYYLTRCTNGTNGSMNGTNLTCKALR